MVKILIIGEDLRSFLAVVRSLGIAGHEVHALPERFNSAALKSRYIHKIHTLSPAFAGIDNWLRGVEKLVQDEAIDLIIPCTDQALIPLLRQTHFLPKGIVAFPGEKAFETFLNKVKTHILCDKLDVPTATYYSISKLQKASAYWPKFLKPKTSFAIDSLLRKREVIKLVNWEQAVEVISSLKDQDDYFVEENFGGIGIGISVLASAGKILYAFQHQRITEGKSGGSSVRISKPIHPQMFKTIIKMAEATELDGVAMFEFKYNAEEETFVLLEVNARFWGSLPLAIFSGVDFPKYWVDQIILQVPITEAPNISYKTNKIARAFMPSIYGFRVKNQEKNVIVRIILISLATLHSIFRQLIGREKIDSFSTVDPFPFFAEFGDFIGTILTKFISVLGLDRFSRNYQLRNSPLRGLKPVTNIVVLCSGNICRSPFLEAFLKSILPSDKYKISSAGFHVPEGRSSPAIAIDTAKKMGISLQEHRSRWCHHTELSAADIILYFDHRNFIDIKAFYQTFLSKSLCVGNYLPYPKDIADPYGGDVETFNACYKDIYVAAMSLINEIEKPILK